MVCYFLGNDYGWVRVVHMESGTDFVHTRARRVVSRDDSLTCHQPSSIVH